MNNSPLARLSPELRNKIYEHVFDSPRLAMIARSTPTHPLHHALTQACGQIYSEAQLMSYVRTEVTFYFGNLSEEQQLRVLARWLKTVSPTACCTFRKINYDFVSIEYCRDLVGVALQALVDIRVELYDRLDQCPVGIWLASARTIARSLEAIGVKTCVALIAHHVGVYRRVIVTAAVAEVRKYLAARHDGKVIA